MHCLAMTWGQWLRGQCSQYMRLNTSNIIINPDYIVCGWCDTNILSTTKPPKKAVFSIKYPSDEGMHTSVLLSCSSQLMPCHKISGRQQTCHVAHARGHLVWVCRVRAADCDSDSLWTRHLTHEAQEWAVMKGLANCTSHQFDHELE